MLYAFFWVILRRLNFIHRRFGTPCLFHLPILLWIWNRQSVPKRRHIKFRRRGITQKIAYNFHITTKVYISTFRKKPVCSIFLFAYEDGTECSETSAYKIQTPGNYSEYSIQHSEHDESLKSRKLLKSFGRPF